MICVLSPVSTGSEFSSVNKLQCMKILNQKFLKIENFQVKYLIIDRNIF